MVTPAAGYYCHSNVNNPTDNTFKYQVTSDAITIFQDNGTESTQKLSATTWSDILSSSKNAIAVVNEDNAAWAETRTNILVKYTDTDNNTTYTCPNFVLTDLTDFTPPYDFTASKTTYSRSSVYTYNSFCLPFAITPQDVDGKIYTFGNCDSNNSSITMIRKTEGVTAGEPCIIKCNNTSTGLTISKTTDTFISKSVVSTGILKGSYASTTIGAGKYKLSSTGTNFGITNVNGKCYPFRSYLDLSNSAKQSFSIVWDDDSITSINVIDQCAYKEENTASFTLSGQKTTSSYKGIQIIRTGTGATIKCLSR